MSWTKLLDRVGGELREELEKIRNAGETRKKKILDEARSLSEKKNEEGRRLAQKEAKMLSEEISSSGRIRAKNIIRHAKAGVINEIYEEFKCKILADDELKKKILEKFLEKNIKAGCEVLVAPDVFALFKKDKKFKAVKFVKSEKSSVPVLILWGRISVSFDWNEFMDELKERTVARVIK